MPTYEYECLDCQLRFEEFQTMTEDAIKECPECKGQVKRLISAGAGLLFKGTGFYITDYRSKDYTKKEQESSDYKPPKKKKTEAKTEA